MPCPCQPSGKTQDSTLFKRRIDLAALNAKAEKLLSSYPGYHVEWLALGLEDIGTYVW
jgi:hypothetical protein